MRDVLHRVDEDLTEGVDELAQEFVMQAEAYLGKVVALDEWCEAERRA